MLPSSFSTGLLSPLEGGASFPDCPFLTISNVSGSVSETAKENGRSTLYLIVDVHIPYMQHTFTLSGMVGPLITAQYNTEKNGEYNDDHH